MHTIEVDFDVFKALLALRPTEDVSDNAVLRKLLKLPPAKLAPAAEAPLPASMGWTIKGFTFPAGTEFRGHHHGKTITANVVNGALFLDGKRYTSPSAAAMSVTGYAVNGWAFWDCKLPGSNVWQEAAALRNKVRQS